MSQFAGDAFDLYELIVQAMERGLELERLERERKLGWGAEGDRVRELMNIGGMQLANAQAAPVPLSLGVGEPVFQE